MFCTGCIRLDECEIIAELRRIHEELKTLKKGHTLITKLSNDPKQSVQDAYDKYRELQLEKNKWVREQMKCLRKREYLQTKGYHCFKG